ncbi:MAG TPA: hypothetical protein VFY29_04260 [Terriglobia bacterium]|nr:hypothetical protein [Terriglobia bacterium]
MLERSGFRAITVFVALLAAAVGTAGFAAQAPHTAPWLGEWRLNMEKSDFRSGPPTFKRVTCVIEPWEDGVRVIYDIVGTRGGVTHTEWSGRFDGRDYPVQGVDTALTNAYTRIDDRTYDIVTRVEGIVEATARVTVSPDGQTITTLTTIRNRQAGNIVTTTVYERRSPAG